MIYNKIYEFCKVRNIGNCHQNGPQPTPRVKFLMDLLDSEGIKYELDVFQIEEKRHRWDSWFNRVNGEKKLEDMNHSWKNKYKNIKNFHGAYDDHGYDDEEEETSIIKYYYNIVMRGSSNRMVIAHHDVNNHSIDNANDNSASCINVIATKKLRPNINAVLVDGEEFGGIGSNRLGKQIKEGKFGQIEWVLNYELTGKGGKYFFIGDYPGKLTDRVIGIFNCPVVHTPFNDSVTLRKYGIDSIVINPLPPLPDGEKSRVLFNDGKYLDFDLLYNCHSARDTVSTISPDDMKEFVEEVVLKIID